jgi:hypothetical protein
MPVERTLSAPPVPVSPRVELARLALRAAGGVDGVAAGDPGRAGAYVTQDGETKLPGVVAAAERDGRYRLDLYLTAELVPFQDLGERVAERVRIDAERAGMAGRLGALHVTIVDVEPGGVT